MSKTTRFFGGAVFATILLFGAGALSPQAAQAASLTSDQISAIIGLLQSFGADQSVIANVQTSLTGGTQAWCHTFNSNLTVGSTGADVSALNQALFSSGIDTSGDTSTFDENTAGDVVSFQAKYGIRQTGYVGPITRRKLNALYGCSGTVQQSTFSALPTSGSAPLSVNFSLSRNDQNNILPDNSYTVDFGDGSTGQLFHRPCDPNGFNYPDGSNSCQHSDSSTASHTYTSAGTYTAKLKDSSGNSLDTVTIKVTSDGTVQPLTVVSPNGGERWQKGTTQNIKWSVTPLSVSSVSISLEPWIACLHTNPRCALMEPQPYVLTASTQNDGMFEWTIGKDSVGADIPAGQYTVTVSGGAFSDSSDAPFSIVVPGTTVAPTITSLQPTSGSVGTSVTIIGTGLTPTDNTVNFGNGFVSGLNSSSGTSLSLVLPSTLTVCPGGPGMGVPCFTGSPVTPGQYQVSVQNTNGTSNAMQFTVTTY